MLSAFSQTCFRQQQWHFVSSSSLFYLPQILFIIIVINYLVLDSCKKSHLLSACGELSWQIRYLICIWPCPISIHSALKMENYSAMTFFSPLHPLKNVSKILWLLLELLCNDIIKYDLRSTSPLIYRCNWMKCER